MSSDLTDAVELQNAAKESASERDENHYSIYNYFKEHTAFAVTCISAMVAVMSFIFNYAINLFNSAYLQYWNVDTLYAIQNAKGQFYTVFMAFVFYVALFVIHAMMSNTADAYYECYKYIYVCRKRFRASEKELKEQKKRILKQKKLAEKHKECPGIYELQAELNDLEQENTRIKKEIAALKTDVSAQNKLLLRKVVVTIIVAVITGVLAFVLLCLNALGDGWGKTLLLSFLIVVPVILIDLALYFLPALFSVRRKYSKVEDKNETLRELASREEEHVFPLENCEVRC